MALQSKQFRGDPKLEAAAVSDPAHIVQGSSGEHVVKIQQALIQVDGAAIKPDGKYGPATARAVSAFKQKRNILNFQGKIDDIVGKKTMAALDGEMLAKETGGGSAGGSRLGFVKELDRDVVHTLIYLSGAGGDKKLEGAPLLEGTGSEVQDAMAGIKVPAPDRKKVFGFGGSNNSDLGVVLAFGVVLARDPRGKLIIYGFSAGAINSLNLCRRLNTAGVIVDLLVTVDVTDGTSLGRTPNVDPTVPSNVRLNRNYFQKSKRFGIQGIETVGPQVSPIDCSNRNFGILPVPLSKSNHGKMEGITQSEAIEDMRRVLTRK